MVKNPPTSSGSERDTVSIPGSGRSLGDRNSNPLQYSRLGNPMDRGALKATIHGVANSRTRLNGFTSLHTIILEKEMAVYICLKQEED